MSTKTSTDLIESAGGVRSEPGGRAQRPAGGEPLELPEAIRDRVADEVIDELLAGATVLACFGRFRGLSICHRLPLVAPARLHKRSILGARIPDEKADSSHASFSGHSLDHFCVGDGVESLVPLTSKGRSGERKLAQATEPTSLCASL
jgi:hypothetical protein